MTGKKGMKHYAVEVKLEAVRMFVEEGKTRAEIAQLLGLRNKERVEVWVRQYRREEDAFRKPIGRPRKQPGKPESEQEELKRLRMENDLLKKFHAELRKGQLAKRNIGSSTTKGKSTK
jgi:transposase